MTRNTLADLNNHLFAQLERLGDEELSNDELNKEITRSNAIKSVAKEIIDNGRLVLSATKFRDEKFSVEDNMPKMLEG